jgi:tRNA modification GTPase
VDGDTIAAVATAPGRGGVGIVRISGGNALDIGQTLAGTNLTPRYAHYTEFKTAQGTVLDSGLALYFSAPNSFTGEDVVELQGHGGQVVVDMILRECCLLGARIARPGEFSERAYLNNKIDLAQAEAIADLINATTEQSALNASRSLQGAFSQKIDELVAAVTQLRIYVEAAIDFPEEEIDFISDGRVREQVQGIVEKLNKVQHQAQQGTLMQEGMKLVIAGKPNAGKSSLLNALSGQDTAIVTAIEGTTRDVLREHIQIDGMPLHIVDTAGLRDSGDEVEQEGIRRAWQEMASADRILLVVDGSSIEKDTQGADLIWPEKNRHETRDIPVTVIHNKCDLNNSNPGVENKEDGVVIHLSAKTGQGLDALKNHLKACIGYEELADGNFSARRRHLSSLEKAAGFLEAGQLQLVQAGAGELLADDLRQCQNALGEITGVVTSDDLLGEIFSSFCIGK